MDNKTLKQIISQIKKYGLVDVFKTTDNFENWISSLNTKQIDNFLNLNIEPKEVANFKSILINNDLLNCQDYSKKVDAISKLKNGIIAIIGTKIILNIVNLFAKFMFILSNFSYLFSLAISFAFSNCVS